MLSKKPVRNRTFRAPAGEDMAGRGVPKAQRIELIASHVVLFAGFAWAGATYLDFLLLLTVEMVLTTLATIPLYPERGWRRHAAGVARLVFGVPFILTLALLVYGAVLTINGGETVPALLEKLDQMDPLALAAFAAWIVVHQGAALWRAHLSPNPRLFWTRERLLDGSATGVAVFAMIFAGIIVALPLVAATDALGAEPPVDLIMIGMMVLIRFGCGMLFASMRESELEKMARNPYESTGASAEH